ncbi:MAG: retron system putative HNH endonuclease [Candidatus Parabeggiatoa sp.]|nr:retron system putative HNH endonuclease [Candidatus Parabeggiatoa sp.]
MKYIQKAPEPEEFAQWKQAKPKKYQSKDWKKLNPLPKQALHEALLKEQGHICCYCERALTKNNSHIEHFVPKKGPNADPNLTFEYQNLLCSCDGNAGHPENKGLTHCGIRKDDWFDAALMVSPLEKDCANYFRYTTAGKILLTSVSEKQQAAEETINRCNLNHPILKKMRHEVLRRIALQSLTDNTTLLSDSLTIDEISQLIQSYSQPDATGKYTPFCTTIIYFLSAYY